MPWITLFHRGEDEILAISIVFSVCIYADLRAVSFILVRVFSVAKDRLNRVIRMQKIKTIQFYNMMAALKPIQP